MPFVVDASVAAVWFMPDEEHPIAQHAFQRLAEDRALMPSLWWFEMRNLLIVNERRNRIVPAQTRETLALIDEMPIAFDREPQSDQLLRLARDHRLTIYDAAYLELALRKNLPLATLDQPLTRAAQQENVELIA